jgi:hypothetical protein
MEERRTKTIENLITYLNDREEHDFGYFFKKIEVHDEYRQESFAETFPEFYELIKPFRKNLPASLIPAEYLPDSI